MVKDFFSVFKFTNKQLQFIIVGLFAIIPITYYFGSKVNNYESSIGNFKDKLETIQEKVVNSETILYHITDDQIKIKEKQNQLYYLMVENNKLIDKKLEFIITHREQDKNYILDAIQMINNSDETNIKNEKVIIFDEKDLDLPSKKPESNISIKKSN
jgi:hypothetical protein